MLVLLLVGGPVRLICRALGDGSGLCEGDDGDLYRWLGRGWLVVSGRF